jgi:hypothetical protein
VALVWVDLPLTIGFALVLGRVAAYVARRGRSRSTSVNAVCVALVAATAWAASFFWDLGYVQAKSREGSMNIFDDPMSALVERREPPVEDFADYVAYKLDHGIWRIVRTRSVPFRGRLVYLAWLCEAALLGFFAWKSANPTKTFPFCEACGVWTEPRELRSAVGILREDVERARDARDLRALASPKTHPEISMTADYVLRECPRCPSTIYLDVDTVSLNRDWLGRLALRTRPAVVAMQLSAKDRDLVFALRAARDGAAANYRSAGMGTPGSSIR